MYEDQVLGFVENYYNYMMEEEKEISEEFYKTLIRVVENEAYWANYCLETTGHATLGDLGFNKNKKGTLSEYERLEFLMLIGMSMFKILSLKVLDDFDRYSSAGTLCNMSNIDKSIYSKWLPHESEMVNFKRIKKVIAKCNE